MAGETTLILGPKAIVTERPIGPTTKLTGLKVNYYLVNVTHPQREDQPPYQAECEDIILALGMTFDEGCLFKALWRSAAARQGNGKPGHKAIYDAEKMVHYAGRILRHTRRVFSNDDHQGGGG
jgi:hypothetical protein